MSAGEGASPPVAGRWASGVLVVAVLLRLWNIDYADWKNPDEQNIIDRALLLPRTGLNPEWFVNPSLFLDVLFAADALFYALGHALGAFASPEEFARFYFARPLLFHVIGRSVSLLAGVGGLLLVYRIGRRYWGAWVGLGAAGLLAVSPVAVAASRTAKVDALACLLLLGATATILRYQREPSDRRLALAAALIGLAMSSKYTTGIALLWLVAVPLTVLPGRAGLARGAAAVVVAGVAFAAATPFAILDWRAFSSTLGALGGLMREPVYGGEGQLGYVDYPFGALPRAFGWVAAALGVAGSLRWLATGGASERLLAGTTAVFYAVMGYGKATADSYLLPVLPGLALAGADLARAALARVGAVRPRLRVALATVAVLTLLPPLGASLRQTALLRARDTREVGAAWLEQHLPPGTRVLAEAYGPRVAVARGRLLEIVTAEEQRGHGMRTRFELERLPPGRGLWYHEIRLFSDFLRFRASSEDYDLERFRRQGYTVVVLSSSVYDRYRRLPTWYPTQNAFYERVVDEGTLLARFGPDTPWCCPSSLNERLSEAAARVWGRPGPTLLVYRL